MEREAEIDLARRLMAGETEAFDSFVENFRAKIFHYSWLMCGQREDAEEVAQDTLLKVFESFDQLREPEKIRPWVFRIAKTACLMKRRKSLFAPSHELSLDEPLLHPEIPDRCGLPDAQAIQSEIKDAIERAIAGLPEIYRSVVLLRDMEELSTEDTAQILEVTEDTVKTRLRRARVALREKLETQGGRDGAR